MCNRYSSGSPAAAQHRPTVQRERTAEVTGAGHHREPATRGNSGNSLVTVPFHRISETALVLPLALDMTPYTAHTSQCKPPPSHDIHWHRASGSELLGLGLRVGHRTYCRSSRGREFLPEPFRGIRCANLHPRLALAKGVRNFCLVLRLRRTETRRGVQRIHDSQQHRLRGWVALPSPHYNQYTTVYIGRSIGRVRV